MDSSCSGQPIHLWQFLKELLLKPHSYGRFIRWLNKEKGEWFWGQDGEAVRWGGAVVLPGAGQGAAAAPTFALNITHAHSLDPEPAQEGHKPNSERMKHWAKPDACSSTTSQYPGREAPVHKTPTKIDCKVQRTEPTP